jgi:tetratricopeptide (TPR) repeat protein
MEGPDGIHLNELIGATDRGMLWRATRQRTGDRIVRIVDPRFCDSRFRQSLSRLRDKPQPRMLPIVGEGFVGVHFYIEYHVDSSWETLEARFKRLHWRLRLALLGSICQVLPLWNNSPSHSLGLNERNIIMVNDLGHDYPWLLPCPALQYASPCDLFDCDSPVISALAPEVIRGVPFLERAQDMYALGILAIHALGCKEAPRFVTDEDRVEAQACGALLFCDIKASEIEKFLYEIESLKRLLQVIQRYAHISPQVRPFDVHELQTAANATVEATKPVVLAHACVNQQNLRGALQILQWGFETFGNNVEERLMAASICESIDEYAEALKHLDVAVESKPDDIKLRSWRYELRSILYEKLPPLTIGAADPEGDILLTDIEWLKYFDQDSWSTNLYHIRASRVYRRRQALEMAAQELYEAAELDPSDMDALFLYGDCLRELGEVNATTQIIQEAHRRLERMVITELMQEKEAQQWREQFDTLL